MRHPATVCSAITIPCRPCSVTDDPPRDGPDHGHEEHEQDPQQEPAPGRRAAADERREGDEGHQERSDRHGRGSAVDGRRYERVHDALQGIAASARTDRVKHVKHQIRKRDARRAYQRATRYRSLPYTPLASPTALKFKALSDETGWADRDVACFERALQGSWVVCRARDDDGRLVGIGRLVSDGALHAFMPEVIVTGAGRGAGFGAQVLAHLAAEARRRGVDDVQLFTAHGRVPFTERSGVVRHPEDGPGMDLAARGRQDDATVPRRRGRRAAPAWQTS